MLRVVLQHPTPTAENRTKLVIIYCLGVDARPRVWFPPLSCIFMNTIKIRPVKFLPHSGWLWPLESKAG